MKDKNTNNWKRSELRDLMKNILKYGDKWEKISNKTGKREEVKYRKHAKRFFIKNSFILQRVYENSENMTIKDFFEFKSNILILNFSTMKLKYKEFKPENLNGLKRNFYKNLKSLNIENSYFDENSDKSFFENFIQDEEYLDSEITSSLENRSIKNFSKNLRDDKKDLMKKNSKSENSEGFDKNYNKNKDFTYISGKTYLNYETNNKNLFTNNNFFGQANQLSLNSEREMYNDNDQVLINFPNNFNNFRMKKQNKFETFSNNNFTNENFSNNQNFKNMQNNGNLFNIEEKDEKINEHLDNNNNRTNNNFNFPDSDFSCDSYILKEKSFNNFPNQITFNHILNNSGDGEEKINNDYNKFQYSDGFPNNYVNGHNSIPLYRQSSNNQEVEQKKEPQRRKSDRDYNMISLRILKRFNSSNCNENKIFYFEKVHGEGRCYHTEKLRISKRSKQANILKNPVKNIEEMKNDYVNLEYSKRIFLGHENPTNDENIDNNNSVKVPINSNNLNSRKNSDIFILNKNKSRNKSINQEKNDISNNIQPFLKNYDINLNKFKKDEIVENKNFNLIGKNETFGPSNNGNNLKFSKINFDFSNDNHNSFNHQNFIQNSMNFKNNFNSNFSAISDSYKIFKPCEIKQPDNPLCINKKRNRYCIKENDNNFYLNKINENQQTLSEYNNINYNLHKSFIDNFTNNNNQIQIQKDSFLNNKKNKTEEINNKENKINRKNYTPSEPSSPCSSDIFENLKIFDIKKSEKLKKSFDNNKLELKYGQNNIISNSNLKNVGYKKENIDETLSSNHSFIDDEDNFPTKNLKNCENVEMKNDLLNYEKEYKLGDNFSDSKNNFFKNNFFNFKSQNQNQIDSNLIIFEKLSELSDKKLSNNNNSSDNLGKLFTNLNNRFNGPNNIKNFDTLINDFNSDIFKKQLNQNNSNTQNNMHFNHNLLNFVNKSNSNDHINQTVSKFPKKFFDDFSNKKNSSRKNSNAKNENYNYDFFKKQERSNSFNINKNYVDISQNLNHFTLNSLADQKNSIENIFELENNFKNKIFQIEKISLEEKGKKEITNNNQKKTNSNFEEEIEDEDVKNSKEDLNISDVSDNLQKSNFNNPTIKALISLRKLNRKKTSVDLTNKNDNSINNQRNYLNSNSNQMKEEKDKHEENDIKKSNLRMKKDKLKLTFEKSVNIEENILSNELNQSQNNNIFNNKTSEANLRKESSLPTEASRKDSFLITKEIRRKDTNITLPEEIKETKLLNNNLEKLEDEKEKSEYLLKINKLRNHKSNNINENDQNLEYNNLKPINPRKFTLGEKTDNSIKNKSIDSKLNFKTIKEKQQNNQILTEIDKNSKIVVKKMEMKINNSKINQNQNINTLKDSQIYTNFNSYYYNIDQINNNNTNSKISADPYPQYLDLKLINYSGEISSNGDKEKNSQFSDENNFVKDYILSSDYNDDLNFSNFSENQNKIKILDNKFEKIISNEVKKKNKPNRYKNLQIKNPIYCNAFNTGNENFEKLYSVNNFQHMKSNKIIKEKNENTNFNYTSNINFENITSSNNNVNPNFFPNAPSITTNNINNFHIINSSGPYIFPITQNITNYGNMLNHSMSNTQKNELKIVTQNFNIINEDCDSNGKIYKIEKNGNKKTEFLNKNDSPIQDAKFNSEKLKNISEKAINCVNIAGNSGSYINQIENFPDFNIGNFNDGPSNLSNKQNPQLRNNSYENLKVFDEKNNFIQDKIINNSIHINLNNNLINNNFNQNTSMSNSFNMKCQNNFSNLDSQQLSIINPNQNKEDFNFMDHPFNINFHFESRIDDIGCLHKNEMDNNKIDIYGLMDFD